MCHRLKKPSTASRNTIDRLKSGAVAALLIVGTTGTAWGQFLCSSDNQVAPAALAERFISADCAFCWRQPVPVPKSASGLTLDWIVPGALGDEAPLSTAANRDALVRLESLDLAAPQTQRLVHQVVATADLRGAVDGMLAELAGCAPISIAMAKRAIERGGDLALADALSLERRCYDETLFTNDRNEGLAAFGEGRPPRFTGT